MAVREKQCIKMVIVGSAICIIILHQILKRVFHFFCVLIANVQTLRNLLQNTDPVDVRRRALATFIDINRSSYLFNSPRLLKIGALSLQVLRCYVSNGIPNALNKARNFNHRGSYRIFNK